MTLTGARLLIEQLDEARRFLLDSRPAMFGAQRFAMCAELVDAIGVLSEMADFMQSEEGNTNSPDFG